MTSHEQYGRQEISQATPMLETDLETIEMQIEALAETETTRSILNNFPAKLPGGMLRSLMVTMPSLLEGPLATRSSNTQIDDLCSERAFKVSVSTFFADVDNALERSGITSEALERIKEAALLSDEEREASYMVLWPVYIHLRMQGYSHHDLRV